MPRRVAHRVDLGDAVRFELDRGRSSSYVYGACAFAKTQAFLFWILSDRLKRNEVSLNKGRLLTSV